MKYLRLIVWVITVWVVTGVTLSAQTVPSDASPKCPLDASTFDKWFKAGKPSLNGYVNPADSVGFTESSVCDFYAWAKQMFLWVTSPSGASRVFDSPVFYDVSPPDSNQQRTFLPHTQAPFTHLMALRFAKEGPHELPIVEDKSGELFEVVQPSIDQSGKQVIVDRTGNLVGVSKAAVTADHKLVLRDGTGNKIEPLFAAVPSEESLPAGSLHTAHEFIVNGVPVLVDSTGDIINVEQGQAQTSGVLESQTDGLVYYLPMTNDVYAYFLTGVKDRAISATQFPATAAELGVIEKYAASHGKPSFSDAQALTVELKSSWIEVNNLTKGNYITTTATIPTYDRCDPNKWVPNGQRKATLGLLGLHIVASVAGHPEMIWATFEHFGDTPNAAYMYINTKGQTVPGIQTVAGTWGFSAPNSNGPFNVPHMKADGANIVAQTGFTVSPSDSLRTYAWGAAGGNAQANTNLISIHNAVSSLMPAHDIRSNYFLVGATWTTAGTAPPGQQAGATNVANSTLETYTQFPGGCFLCHSSRKSPSLAPDVLSHVFGGESTGLQPLFPPSVNNPK